MTSCSEYFSINDITIDLNVENSRFEDKYRMLVIFFQREHENQLPKF